MNTADPIRDRMQLKLYKDYYVNVEPSSRNYLLILTCLYTALRISDILEIRYGDIYDFVNKKGFKHLMLTEKKTGKSSTIFLRCSLTSLYSKYIEELQVQENISANDRIFNLSRVQAWRIIKKPATYYNIEGTISCHSLRKTFGYFAWKQGTEPALLMDIYNHSSYLVTKRYLGITQEDRDSVFEKVNI